jgi:beta-galactosidase/beta-glucuronidase
MPVDDQAMKAMGFNAVRKHMKVDTRRWYYHADRLGLAVWQVSVKTVQKLDSAVP